MVRITREYVHSYTSSFRLHVRIFRGQRGQISCWHAACFDLSHDDLCCSARIHCVVKFVQLDDCRSLQAVRNMRSKSRYRMSKSVRQTDFMNRALQYLFLQEKKIGFPRLTLPLSKKRKIELIPAQIDLCLYLRPSSIHLYKTSLEEMSETKNFANKPLHETSISHHLTCVTDVTTRKNSYNLGSMHDELDI